MEGPVQWAVLIFMGSLALGSMGLAWKVRGWLAAHQEEINKSLAALANSINDRNFLLKYDLAIADLTKDVRHTKANLEQHGKIFGDLHDDVIRMQSEVARLGKIVNGK